MAWYDWFRPLGVGAVGLPAEQQATYLNLLLPFLNPAERYAASGVLNASASEDVQNALGRGYNFAPGTARAEADWLAGLGGLRGALGAPPVNPIDMMEGTQEQRLGAHGQYKWQSELASLEGDPNLAWFQRLGDIAATLGPTSTRAQQRDAKARMDTWMANAPENMRSVGSFLLNPYLDRPRYGAAATFGTYRAPYQVKGGLVANPWYT